MLLSDRKDPFAHLTPRRLALTVIKSSIVAGAPLLNEAILDSLDEEVGVMLVSRWNTYPFILAYYLTDTRHVLHFHTCAVYEHWRCFYRPFPVKDFLDLFRHCVSRE